MVNPMSLLNKNKTDPALAILDFVIEKKGVDIVYLSITGPIKGNAPSIENFMCHEVLDTFESFSQ